MKIESRYDRLERYLNRLKYSGVPMGGTLADQLALTQLHGVQSARKSFLHLFWDFSYLLFSVFRKKRPILNTRIIATWLIDKHHFNNMMIPLIRAFKDQITVISNPDNIKKTQKTNLISIRETYNTPVRAIPGILYYFCQVVFLLFRNRKRLDFSNKELLFYSQTLFHQAKIISFYDYQFNKSKSKPRIAVTEFDRNSIASPMVLTARKNGIKTITLVHGIIGDDFTPLLADRIFCFGEIQRVQLMERNVPAERIKITGTSIIPEFKEFKSRRNNNNRPTIIVCLGVQPLKKIYLDYKLKTVIEAASHLSQVELIIKLHPSQRKEDFIHLQGISSRVNVLSSSDIDNADLFSKIDLLIINFSGLGVEAMHYGVPVILIRTRDEENRYLTDSFAKWSGLPVFETSSELESIINTILYDRTYLDGLSNKGKEFAGRFYYATGSRAVSNIVREIIEYACL
jgi:hypothetical protein